MKNKLPYFSRILIICFQENASEFYHTPEKEIEERLISEENKDALKNYVIKVCGLNLS